MRIKEILPKSGALGIVSLVLLSGLSAVLAQDETSISSTNTPDMIVTISEDYLNRVIKADLQERNIQEVKDINVQLTEGGPIEVNAALKIGSGLLSLEQNVALEANISIENDSLKVTPEVLKVGLINLPEKTWIGPINSALSQVEASANEAYQDALAQGYKVTSVTTGNNTMTLSVMAPDNPFQIAKK